MRQDQNLFLSSAESFRVSLEAVWAGHAGLSEHRKSLLKRVPESGDWASFPRESISLKDIAYLSAAEHHEFALLRGKQEDIIFHGTAYHCEFENDLCEMLITRKFRLVAHTHPDRKIIVPSAADRNFLKTIGQTKSVIISYITGVEKEFTSNIFEEI